MEERILVLDGVHKKIVGLLENDGYQVTYLDKDSHPSSEQLSDMLPKFDGFVIRSYPLAEKSKVLVNVPNNILAVGRAGAGVNNIPHGELKERGIVVFNTPGSNANAVRELVIPSMIMASRNLYDAITWTNTLEKEVSNTVEKEKKRFKGSEINGKTLGVIGLGNIGRLVAEDGVHFGMTVLGYDPFLSKENRDSLAGRVEIVSQMEDLLTRSDYLSIHSAYIPGKNHNMIGQEQISKMKRGVVLANFARGELVDNKALTANIAAKRVSTYITDFPCDELQGIAGVIRIPHLGASTDEAEENCAIMIAHQFDAYFKRGEIRNSVNYPKVQLEGEARHRLGLLMKDRTGLINEITGAFSKRGINISDMSYNSSNGHGYFLGDSESPISAEMLSEVEKIPGFIRSRIIEKQ